MSGLSIFEQPRNCTALLLSAAVILIAWLCAGGSSQADDCLTCIAARAELAEPIDVTAIARRATPPAVSTRAIATRAPKPAAKKPSPAPTAVVPPKTVSQVAATACANGQCTAPTRGLFRSRRGR